MRPYLLTAAARKYVIDIGRFTTEKWGKCQRDKYLRQLDDAFKLLARQPDIGRDADTIKPRHRKFSLGSHIIFYRAGTESRFVVIRILYNSMDVDQHV
ncbi:type II toxin-antitoxin system RelE/ParE family toxin [Bowmanella denitrificans]|uniref:type II toxin-antitoxin system RelE/ParE family toxin n=1 Tax=Bowmanella denitrificans TaxID=366582 RepID=UPI000C99AA5F|nr:type II toxin-antitoxin system RelE/ParE family toxin [Bowmanella denitrificans]